MRPKSKYTVWNIRENRIIIADATKEEAAKALGVRVNSFAAYIGNPPRGIYIEKTGKVSDRVRKESWKKGWIRPENGYPEDTEPVLVIVSGRYMGVEFVSAVMLASFDANDDDGGWILEEYPGWLNPHIEYWCYTPPLPFECKEHIKERMGER